MISLRKAVVHGLAFVASVACGSDPGPSPVGAEPDQHADYASAGLGNDHQRAPNDYARQYAPLARFLEGGPEVYGDLSRSSQPPPPPEQAAPGGCESACRSSCLVQSLSAEEIEQGCAGFCSYCPTQGAAVFSCAENLTPREALEIGFQAICPGATLSAQQRAELERELSQGEFDEEESCGAAVFACALTTGCISWEDLRDQTDGDLDCSGLD